MKLYSRCYDRYEVFEIYKCECCGKVCRAPNSELLNSVPRHALEYQGELPEEIEYNEHLEMATCSKCSSVIEYQIDNETIDHILRTAGVNVVIENGVRKIVLSNKGRSI